jgi:hypothetical protein
MRGEQKLVSLIRQPIRLADSIVVCNANVKQSFQLLDSSSNMGVNRVLTLNYVGLRETADVLIAASSRVFSQAGSPRSGHETEIVSRTVNTSNHRLSFPVSARSPGTR